MFRRTDGLNRHLIEFVFGVVRHPVRTLVLCLVGVAAAVTLAYYRLDVSTDQDQLFSSNVPFFRDYLSFAKNFPENQAAYVVVQAKDQAHPPAVGRWTAVADAIAAKLSADHDNVRTAEAHVSIEQMGRQGLLFTDDPTEVPRRRKEVERIVPLVKRWGEKPDFLYSQLGASPLQRFINGLSRAPDKELTTETAELANLMAVGWSKAIADPHRPVTLGDQVPDLATLGATTPRDLGYSYIPNPEKPDQSLLLVKVFEQRKLTSLDGQVRVIAGIRADVEAAAQPFLDDFTVGLSGRPALDADELSTTDKDSRKAEIVSLTAVFIGLAIFLRSIWLAVAAEIALLVGIGWTFGWATLSTAAFNRTLRGDLNLLSMVFLIALIGIGMDYLIQVLTRYRQEAVRHAADPGRDPRSIWAAVFKHVAAPINTACLGAGGAFLVSVLTPFRGAAELGLIAGGGLLLCLLTGYVVLPALLSLFPAKIKPTAAERDAAVVRRRPPAGAVAPPPRPPTPAGNRHRKLILPAIWAALLLAGIPYMRRTSFDPGLLSLQSQSLESVKLVRQLPTWFDVELSKDERELRQVRRAVEQLPVVARTESVLSAWDHYNWLRANPLPDIHWANPTPVGGGDLSNIATRSAVLADRFSGMNGEPFATAAAALRALAEQLRSINGPVARELAGQRLTLWQTAFVAELHDVLAPFFPTPPDLDALPETVRGHLRGTDGRLALYIYPKADLWQQANLAAFVTAVEKAVADLDNNIPPVTGVATDVFHSTDQTHASFRNATIYALVLIFVLVLVDLKDLRQTLLAISVLALGLPMLVAVMGVVGINWNFANFFGLPILIGAGHEYGVFMVHRYNEACRDAHRPWRKWDVSDRALLLCGYVTSISFGFFWLFGHHLGLKSLGLVMALGITCIYLATVCVLRPLLLWKLAGQTATTTAPAAPVRQSLASPA